MLGAASLGEIVNTGIGSFSLGKIITAILVLAVCLLVSKLLMKLVTKIVSKSKLDEKVGNIITAVLKAVLTILTVIFVCSELGINTTSIVALLSVVSLGITMASESVLSNIAAGLVIIITKPFKVGDAIKIGDLEGTVTMIKLNYTTILTLDGVKNHVPNKDVAAARIGNYSENGRRRVVLTVNASYDAKTEDVKKACLEAIETQKGKVLASPKPSVLITNYGDSAIEYTMFFWVKPADYIAVRGGVNEALRAAFENNNVEMTYAHVNVHILEDKK